MKLFSVITLFTLLLNISSFACHDQVSAAVEDSAKAYGTIVDQRGDKTIDIEYLGDGFYEAQIVVWEPFNRFNKLVLTYEVVVKTSCTDLDVVLVERSN
ncbi:hypothetical protein HBN50_11575 [Halobacteriovorax sp. GB3]|uniref:hypothetical protein n=1 Tax=Halobacteriovorax sp. GB3 TaxID=2719615 RepID=UPI00235F65A2|nr:hypothetical protein [Halobacteriovorax sp. GB3]MDD0853741.1 hypothetical protein [Halobacteriovorax sp. GB3]